MSPRSYRRSRHLPGDLLPQILRRLPVKSLLRFRCVSKPWQALVDNDDDFTRLHLDTFKNNSDQTRLFVVQGRPSIYSVRSADTFESIYVDRSTDFLSSWEIISYVDGLVLLTENHVLKMWNPSLRKFYELEPADHMYSYTDSQVIGLGYDSRDKDYKIVTYFYDTFVSDFPAVVIYTLCDGSSDIIPFQSKGPSRLGKVHTFHRSVYLNGSLYFLRETENWEEEEAYQDSLWSFDLSSEEFSVISMPHGLPGDIDDYVHLELLLVDGGSSLAMYDRWSNSMWVLERDTMKWTKRCLWSNSSIELKYCKKNGDMLTYHEKWSSGREVKSYCPEKKEFKTLGRTPARYEIKNVFTYVESLVLNGFR